MHIGKRRITQLFDNIMLYEDISSLFSDRADSAQMFSTNPGAKYAELKRSKTGEIKLGEEGPIYTNRRPFAGDGWAVELHTVTLSANARKPERRYRLEVAVLCEVAPSGSFTRLAEYGEPGAIKRVADLALLAGGGAGGAATKAARL